MRGGYKGLRRDFVGTSRLIAQTAIQKIDCDSSEKECMGAGIRTYPPHGGYSSFFYSLSVSRAACAGFNACGQRDLKPRAALRVVAALDRTAMALGDGLDQRKTQARTTAGF